MDIHNRETSDSKYLDIINVSQELSSCVDFISFYSELERMLFRYGGCSKYTIIIYYDQLKEFYIDHSNFFSSDSFSKIPVNLENTGLYKCFSNKESYYYQSGDEKRSLIFIDESADILGFEPLLYKSQIYGLIVFHECAEETVLDRNWLELITNFAATAIINLQLYQETNQEATENSAKLWAINSAGELLSHMNLDILLVKVMELTLGIISAQVGSIILEEEGKFVTKVEWGLSDEILNNIKHVDGRLLIDFVRENQEPFLVMNAKDDPRIDISALDVAMDSLIIIPLYTNDRFLGLVNIVNPSGSEKSYARDTELLVTITNLVSISVENAILYKEALEKERIREQLNIARKIQQDLMPAEPPQLKHYDITGINITCDETGGDYYDYFSIQPDSFLNIVVGDVSGHGIGAALFMATARAHIRASVNNNTSISKSIEAVNNLLVVDMEKNDQFMTLFVMRLDIRKKELYYTSAGHETAIIYRKKEDRFIELRSTGLPLGLIEDSTFEEQKAQLKAGDVILLYTDGIKEAMDKKDELFGYERIKELVRKHADLPVIDIRKNILDTVMEFSSGCQQQDDWTVVVIKVKDPTKKETNSGDQTSEVLPSVDVAPELPSHVSFLSSPVEITGNKMLESIIQSNMNQKDLLLEEIMVAVEKMELFDIENEFNLRLSLDEAITNGIKHGNKNDMSKKLFVAMYNDDKYVSFLIKDEGAGFSEEKFRYLLKPNQWFEENGRGVYLISKLMDEVIYFDSGTSLLMKKLLPRK